MTVGERIKELRTKLGINQVDFADKINISKQTLYKYENNVITNIPIDKIEVIAQTFNISPAYLMGWDTYSKNEIEKLLTESQKINNFINNIMSDDETFKKRFILALSKLNETEWNTLEKISTNLSLQPTPQESDIEEQVKAYRDYLETKEKATEKLSS